MKSIEIAHFKGYKRGISLDCKDKSILVFGENGAGKSSLYEALKIWFFKTKIKSSLMSPGRTPEEREQALNDYLSARQNHQEKVPFVIKVDGSVEMNAAEREKSNIFMISASDLSSSVDDIVLGRILPGLFFDGVDASFLTTHFEELQNVVNRSLRNDFSEALEIRIDPSDSFRCTVVDRARSLEDSGSLSLRFNESKINLIRLLLMLHIIRIAANDVPDKVLILDDFVTSMDAANRAFIIRFLINEFCATFQLILLTHSAGFYNLCKFEIESMIQQKKCREWEYYCLYSAQGDCRCYREKGKAQEHIKDLKESIIRNEISLEDAGNEIRQFFEILIHKLARRLQSGGLEESKSLINRILSTDVVYLHDNQTANDLIDQLYALINNDHYRTEELAVKINQKIDLFSLRELSTIKETISDLKLFQKVALHPSSHAVEGHSPVSRKELDQSVILLERLDSLITKIDIHDESAF